ncbi:MAG: hypothetical protein K2I40_03855, partial [Bifidobacterium castoris]|nr:hypothetical protein [Bifidobacterium castoris]
MSRAGYARLSNEFWRNTKVRKLKRRHGMAAVGLFALIVAYCSDTLSDGHVSEDVLIYQLDADEDMIAALCEVGMLDKTDDGYRVHDYLLHQNSREQIETKAAANRARQRRFKEKHLNEDEPDDDNALVTRYPGVSNALVTRYRLTKNQEPRTNNQYSSQVVEEANTVDAHTREAASAPDNARVEDVLLDAWLPAGDDLARAAELGVDGDALADKMRDKLARKGFDACGVHRRTPRALDAMFRTWVEHEAQWAGEG